MRAAVFFCQPIYHHLLLTPPFLAIGDIDSSLDTVGVWLAERDEATKGAKERTPESNFTRGIVYYLRKNKIVGILLWNANDQMQRAREVLASGRVVSEPAELLKTISLGPEDWIDVIVAGPQ